MRENFEFCLAHVLKSEGGWSDHKDDPGGATMKGVTLLTYRKFYGADKTKEDLRQISPGALSHIYRTGYWNKCLCDDLSDGVDLTVFDGAVNSGPGRSVKWLQAAVGAAQDGHIGSNTISKTQAEDGVSVIHGICDQRLSFLKALSTWPSFGKGWQRRVEQLRADAVALSLGKVPNATVPPEQFEIVRTGDSGGWVTKVQKCLGVDADGIFGSNTEKALKNWQEKHGLAPDGIAGWNTYRAMGLIA